MIYSSKAIIFSIIIDFVKTSNNEGRVNSEGLYSFFDIIFVFVAKFLRTNYTFFFFESINNPPKNTNTPKIDVNTRPYSYENAEIPKNCVSGYP